VNFESFKQKTVEIFALNPALPALSDEQIEKLFRLTEIMLEVNKSMNLTAITDVDGVILKHYADSLTISEYIPEGSRIIDVGCGAGFPTLPLAIFRPDISITALDGTAKRIEYVRATAELLGLENVKTVAARAEEFSNKPDNRESFDIATARAVAALPVLAELCLPFVKKNGKFIAMKASQGENEALSASNAIKICGGGNAEIIKADLFGPNDACEQRIIIRVAKISSTPAKYPRHYSQISKKPL
jgi:16S rRNA (guanine527-N7)-methyltransferase